MYFCYQSENAFISYVIVFWQAGHGTLLPSVCCFVRHSVCSALSALSPTQEPVFNFLPSNCLLFNYSLCIEHSETTNIARWTGGTQSSKRERPLRTSVLPDKDHIVLLTEKVTQRIQISPVIMRLCLLANTKNQKLMLVNFVSSQWLHLGIKFTFFVVLDTPQSIKRKHFWGRYGGGVIGSWYKPIRSKVSNSDQTLPRSLQSKKTPRKNC